MALGRKKADEASGWRSRAVGERGRKGLQDIISEDDNCLTDPRSRAIRDHTLATP